MKRVLLTGMSGTGKSTVIEVLRERGFKCVDMDEPGWSVTAPDGDWIWNEERVAELLAEEDAEYLFVSGCAENQRKFYDRLDHVILLSAPAEVLLERLRTRTNNPYGKSEAQQADVLHYLDTVEPLLRSGASAEIVTTAPINVVVDGVLALVGAGRST